MRVKVLGAGREPSPRLCRYAEMRAWLALHRLARHVHWVTIRLGDPRDDPKRKTRCAIDVWLRRAGVVLVEQTRRDPHSAIDVACSRARAATRRRLRQHYRRGEPERSGRPAGQARLIDNLWRGNWIWQRS